MSGKISGAVKGLLAAVTLLAALTIPVACLHATANGDEVSRVIGVEVIYSGVLCGRRSSEPVLGLIKDSPAYSVLQERLERTRVGSARVFRDIDFSKESLLLVEMGMRPTAGYSVTLEDDFLNIEGETATLGIRFREPGPGDITAQMITSPCALIRIPSGGYSAIQVIDRSAKGWIPLSIPK